MTVTAEAPVTAPGFFTESLAERDRLAMLMRAQGMNYEEIAAALEHSVGSVGTTLARARRKLAESYEA
jgi:RNA polymerase sigma-70 factor (ECF subfamily)